MTFQPGPQEPDGPLSPEEEAHMRRHALQIGAELERRGMSWVIGPAAGRLEGDPYALYHVRDAAGEIHSFPTLDALDTWLEGASGAG